MVPTVNPVTEEAEVANGSARWHVRSDVANKIIKKKIIWLLQNNTSAF